MTSESSVPVPAKLALTYSNGVIDGARIALLAINDNLDLSIENSNKAIEIAIDTLKYNESLCEGDIRQDKKVTYYRGVLSACRFAKSKLEEIKE